MLHPQTLLFLKWLADFNDKKFMDMNRKIYEQIAKSIKVFTKSRIEELGKFDPHVKWTPEWKCIFRINRDTRYSHNKLPYKENFGIFIAPWWKTSKYWGYYLHIQPWSSFFGWWMFYPETQDAYLIRQHIYDNPEEFLKLKKDKQFLKYFKDLYTFQQPLKNLPKGMESKGKIDDFLKYKDWLVTDILVQDEDILSQELLHKVVNYSEKMYPMLEFLREWLDK